MAECQHEWLIEKKREFLSGHLLYNRDALLWVVAHVCEALVGLYGAMQICSFANVSLTHESLTIVDHFEPTPFYNIYCIFFNLLLLTSSLRYMHYLACITFLSYNNVYFRFVSSRCFRRESIWWLSKASLNLAPEANLGVIIVTLAYRNSGYF